MINYLIVHNKHEGCYDFQCYQDDAARIRLTSITINPPKIFMFRTRDEAQEFFEEYINDVDCIDIKCKRGEEVEHVDFCTCGIIELDDKGEPILFYNKRNQIFLLEHGPQIFIPNNELKTDIRNLNLTNRLIRKCKSLGREQRKRYIELGKYCEECNGEEPIEEEEKPAKKSENVIIEIKMEPKPADSLNYFPTPVTVSIADSNDKTNIDEKENIEQPLFEADVTKSNKKNMKNKNKTDNCDEDKKEKKTKKKKNVEI